MKKHQQFLRFNDKPIFFINQNGEIWISLISICEALGIDHKYHLRKAKKDYVIGPEMKLQPMLVTSKAVTQLRKVMSLPEFMVYGWLMTINADNEELKEYRRSCIHILHNHFKGSITKRKDVLIKRKVVLDRISTLEKSLKEKDEKYIELQNLKKEQKKLSSQLTSIDNEMVKDPELFDELPVTQVP